MAIVDDVNVRSIVDSLPLPGWMYVASPCGVIRLASGWLRSVL